MVVQKSPQLLRHHHPLLCAAIFIFHPSWSLCHSKNQRRQLFVMDIIKKDLKGRWSKKGELEKWQRMGKSGGGGRRWGRKKWVRNGYSEICLIRERCFIQFTAEALFENETAWCYCILGWIIAITFTYQISARIQLANNYCLYEFAQEIQREKLSIPFTAITVREKLHKLLTCCK